MLQVPAKQPSLPPTDEQLAILDLVRADRENLQINALAGTGKTTTLEMIVHASRRSPILCLAFNKRIAEEMKKRFPGTTTVKTFNGLGHSAWQKNVGTLKLDDKKMNELFKQVLEDYKGEDRKFLRDNFFEIINGVAKAKSLGYVPEGKYPTAKRLLTREAFHAALDSKPSPLEAEIIDTLLFRSIQGAYDRWIDFNDQIYMPTLFGGAFPRFPVGIVDEEQDLNPVNHEMLRKCFSGRFIGVGDPWQSIYAFRGAVQGGMSKLKEAFKCEEANLSTSFRCPRAIVELARWRVPHFRWMKEGGAYEKLSSTLANDFPEGCAILCRNNAPLFALAFRLLAAKRSVQVAGSEIGPRIIRLLQKIGDARDDSEALIAKIDAWLNQQLEKSNAPKSLEDQAACLKIFATFGANLAQAVAYAEHLFAQQGTIKLSTVHKAKGLEWDTVYFLDRWLCGDEEQDLNLQYVAETRSKDQLFEIDSRSIQWGSNAN